MVVTVIRGLNMLIRNIFGDQIPLRELIIYYGIIL